MEQEPLPMPFDRLAHIRLLVRLHIGRPHKHDPRLLVLDRCELAYHSGRMRCRQQADIQLHGARYGACAAQYERRDDV
jgi:hypothetical protein